MAYSALPHRTKHLESTQTTEGVGSSSTASDHSLKSERSDRSEKHEKHNKAHEKNEPRQWAYISDTVVRLTTLDEVLKSKAYMCLYERIS